MAFVTALEFGMSLGGGVSDQLSWVVFVFIIFIICLPVGIIATISMLTIFGLPIAYLARDTLATTTGSAIAMVSAVAISALVTALLGGVEVIIFVLPFSIPAAILFRREILLDRTLP